MKRDDLLSELAVRTLCCDGAMGTQLLARGLAGSESGMLWNADHPGNIRAVHEAYRRAGCDLITTNSFGGSAFALKRHGLENRVAELNRAAAQVAREAAGETAGCSATSARGVIFSNHSASQTPRDDPGYFSFSFSKISAAELMQ